MPCSGSSPKQTTLEGLARGKHTLTSGQAQPKAPQSQAKGQGSRIQPLDTMGQTNGAHGTPNPGRYNVLLS